MNERLKDDLSRMTKTRTIVLLYVWCLCVVRGIRVKYMSHTDLWKTDFLKTEQKYITCTKI